MSSTEQLQKLIRSMVLKEAKEIVPSLVREVMSNMLMEVAMNPSAQASPNNSYKRKNLTEASYGRPEEMDEYPTARFSRSDMASMMGYGDMIAAGGGRNELIVSAGHTEHGTPVPVDPRSLPDHVVNALTKDYRGIVQAWDKKKNG